MVQKTQKKKTVKAKKASVIEKSKALEVAAPKVVPAVIPTADKPAQQSRGRKILTGILFVVTLVVWFLVGQNAFYLVTENLWLAHRGGRSLPANNEVVATIGGEPILMKDVRSFAAGIPQLAEVPFEVIYPQLLERMINSRVLLKAADQAGAEGWPDVQKALQLSRDQIVSQAYLMKQLEKSVTPEQMQALYDQEAQNFKPVDEVHASHILVKTEEEAKDILVQLRAGADFGALADTKSLDRNNVGGDLGYFTEDMVVPEFGKAAFSLKKGQLSEPVKTDFGWHVILLQDRRPITLPAFDEVKDQIKQILMEQNTRRVMAEEWKKMDVQIKKKRK